MGGGVSSLPAEVSLAEAKELAGARWQPAWEEKFAEAKISRDDAIQCWQETEANAAISEELYEKLHGANRSRVAEALDFSAIVNEKRGQHLPGTREWVFEAVLRWRTDADSAKLFWLVGGGGTGKSVAAAELLARLLDKQNAAAWHFCKHTEPGRSAPAVLLRSLAGMLCATVEGFEDALKGSAGVETDKVDELFESLVAKPLRSVEAPRGADDALVLIIDALDELPRGALEPVLSLLANELKMLPPWIKIVATSRDEAQIKGALSGYTPSELRVDEARNRQDVRAYLTELAKEHIELEVTMESLRHEVEAKFPELAGRLGGFAALEDPLRRAKATYAEAMRGVSGLDKLEAYKERRDPNLKQDEGDFEMLYAQAAVAQKILVESLKKLRDDVQDPGVKGRPRSLQKLANDYGGDARYLKDLSRATILFETPDELLDVLERLGSVGLEIAQVKNKFAHPTPMGYRDFNLNIRVPLDDGQTHIAEFQLNLKSIADAKHIAHDQYEVIRAALPDMCKDTSVGADALEAFISERLNSSALDAAVNALERKADGLMLYARLIADQLEATSGKIDFASVGALPAGLDEIYAENFRRVFVDDGAWSDALPLVELICAAAEPLTVEAASGALGWDRTGCERLCADVSLLFPLREGDMIGVLHKTVTDWLTGEAPFDKRSSEDAFFVSRDAAHRRLARASARAVRAGVLDTEAYSSDAAADEVLASFVEGEGGVASDAYALRWCLFHLKRSNNESEAVAIACSLSYVRKRSASDIVSFVADLNVLQGQDTLLLSDSLVLSRNALSVGVPVVEQLWQRLMPRANAESSPAALRLADDAKRVASKISLSTVRPIGLTAAGGAERCRIEIYASCLATFVDPATGEPRVACGCYDKVRICDPVAGGAALVVIDVGADALVVFKDPATGELRLACGCDDGKVRIFDPVAGGEALLVIDVGDEVKALVVFEDPATGELRLACGCDDKKVRVFDPVEGGETLVVLEVGDRVEALAVFTDPATGKLRLACGTGGYECGDVRIYDPVAGGDALLVLDIGSKVKTLVVFKEPATGAPRLACGSDDGKVRVFDVVSGGGALLVLDAGDVRALVAFEDLATGASRLACGSGDFHEGRVHVFDPVAGGEALVVLEGHTFWVTALTAFTDPARDEPRLVSGSSDVRVWNPAAGGAAIEAEPEGHSQKVEALVTFVDPATGALRVATGSQGGIRVWDAETGGALLVIDIGSEVEALAFFTDPGASRLACGCYDGKVRVFDAVAGGKALLVIDAGATVYALAMFADPATGAPRLACGCRHEVRVVDPVVGGEALVVIDVGLEVRALAAFADPATGELRHACGTGNRKAGDVRVFDAVAGGDVLLVLAGHTRRVLSLTVYEDPATGALRLASGSEDGSVRVWDLAGGGAALFVLDGGGSALTAFADPATGEMRLVSGSEDKTLRVWDASTGVALRVVAFEDEVNVLTVGRDMSGLFVAFGKRWGELRIESGTTPLTLACYQGGIDAIRSLLQQGAGVDQQDDDGYTPLFVTSLKGHVDAARLLLDAGAAVDKRREGRWSPFGIACALGHVAVATLLLERGADSAAVKTCIGGMPPLLVANRNQNLDAMRLCLAQGADVNWANEEGGTVLYDACTNGHVDTARLLLDNDAEVDRANQNGATPLYAACERGDVAVAQLLLGRGAVVKHDSSDSSALCAGDAVETRYRGREKYYPGKVSRDHGNGTYNIAYNDGKRETRVEAQLIRKLSLSPLSIACKNGHVDVARLLLDNGAEVDRADRDGATPLWTACQKGHVDAARLLLDKGAEVDRATKDGRTALHAACRKGSVDAAQLLLEKGAEVDRADEDGETPLDFAKRNDHDAVVALLEQHLDSKFPLHAATRTGDVDAMTQLLDSGTAVDQTKGDGTTSLFLACENGHIEAVRLLLEKGAEVDRANEKGLTPLFLACQNGNVDAARLLLDNGAEVNRATERGQTPLLIACEEGHVDAARLLLDNGAEVNRATERGQTPLFIACEEGHVDTARLLLDKGAEVDRADKRGRTPLDIAKRNDHDTVVALLEEHIDAKFPLHAAARTGDVEAITQLLDSGAEVDAEKNGATPLFVACEGGIVDAARLLLDKGAEVDRAMKDGRTPLYIACEKGHVDAARLLLDKGAEVDREDKRGRTPLAIAKRNDHDAVVAVVALFKEHLDSKFPLHAAARTGDVEAMTHLLDGGAEVDAEKNGATPLFVACQNGNVDAARLLLDKGAEVDRAMKDGRTPLYIACEKGHVDAAQLLLDKGAEVDREDEDGWKPMAIAQKKGHSSIVTLLEEHLDSKFPLHAAARTGDVEAMTQLLDGGAEVDAKKDGATPLFIACQCGHVDLVRLLLDKGAEVDRATDDGTTPLIVACEKGHVDAARLLLDKGAEVDRAEKNYGATALLIACSQGHANLARLLLEKGAAFERLDDNYLAAARTGDVEAMTRLLDGGATVHQAREDGALGTMTSGWVLRKVKKNDKWVRRWLEVNRHVLNSYQACPAESPQARVINMLDLRKTREIKLVDGGVAGLFCIVPVSADGQHPGYLMRADTAANAQEWVTGLNVVRAQEREKSPRAAEAPREPATLYQATQQTPPRAPSPPPGEFVVYYAAWSQPSMLAKAALEAAAAARGGSVKAVDVDDDSDDEAGAHGVAEVPMVARVRGGAVQAKLVGAACSASAIGALVRG